MLRRRLGRIQRSQRRAHHHSAAGFWAPACASHHQRFPCRFPGDRRAAGAGRPEHQFGRRPYRHGRAHWRIAGQQHDRDPGWSRAPRCLRQPGYFAAHGTPKTPADLADLTCVTLAGLASGAPWAFASRRGGLAQAVPPRCRLHVNTAEAAIDAAIAGVGITHVLSYQVARAVAAGKLRIVLSAFEAESPAGQPHPCRPGSAAAQDAAVSRIRGTAPKKFVGGRPV